MKPRIFIASSTETLPIAYSVQENLEHNAECTVWTQGIFGLSKTSLDSLVQALDKFDFGVFVLGPDDTVKMRGKEYQSARDNVIFELGLFVGKLGIERNFLIAPRGQEDFHLPTDLLGLTPATYDSGRSDANLNAALGPACHKINKAVQSLGAFSQLAQEDLSSPKANSENHDESDIVNLIATYIRSKREGYGDVLITYNDVDKQFGFTSGTAEQYIEQATEHSGYYKVRNKGKSTITLSYRVV